MYATAIGTCLVVRAAHIFATFKSHAPVHDVCMAARPFEVALQLQEPLALSIVMGKPFAGSLNGAY